MKKLLLVSITKVFDVTHWTELLGISFQKSIIWHFLERIYRGNHKIGNAHGWESADERRENFLNQNERYIVIRHSFSCSWVRDSNEERSWKNALLDVDSRAQSRKLSLLRASCMITDLFTKNNRPIKKTEKIRKRLLHP